MSDKNPRLDPDGTLPRIPGWVALTEAGDLLGVSRQHAYRMARERTFKSLARVGDSFTIVVSTDEVEEMQRERREAAEARRREAAEFEETTKAELHM